MGARGDVELRLERPDEIGKRGTQQRYGSAFVPARR
jgi:hypothetical protein